MTGGLVILQARLTSSRLPGKVMLPVNGRPMIYWQIKRIMKANVAPIVVATSTDPSDDVLVKFLEEIDIEVYRGSLDNVFQRFYDVIEKKSPEYIIRLTGDCPLFMPKLLIKMDSEFRATSYDYFTNTLEITFPDGLDIEIIKSEAMRRCREMPLSGRELEHVTLGIYTRPEKFTVGNYSSDSNLGHFRWTVDYPEDYDFVKRMFKYFEGSEDSFTLDDVIKVISSGAVRNNSKSGSFRNIALQEKGEQQ